MFLGLLDYCFLWKVAAATVRAVNLLPLPKLLIKTVFDEFYDSFCPVKRQVAVDTMVRFLFCAHQATMVKKASILVAVNVPLNGLVTVDAGSP